MRTVAFLILFVIPSVSIGDTYESYDDTFENMVDSMKDSRLPRTRIIKSEFLRYSDHLTEKLEPTIRDVITHAEADEERLSGVRAIPRIKTFIKGCSGVVDSKLDVIQSKTIGERHIKQYAIIEGCSEVIDTMAHKLELFLSKNREYLKRHDLYKPVGKLYATAANTEYRIREETQYFLKVLMTD